MLTAEIIIHYTSLWISVYLSASAYHEYTISDNSFWLMASIIFGVCATFPFMAILSLLSFGNNRDDGNGGKKKIYPDDKDFSEKVMELYQ